MRKETKASTPRQTAARLRRVMKDGTPFSAACQRLGLPFWPTRQMLIRNGLYGEVMASKYGPVRKRG